MKGGIDIIKLIGDAFKIPVSFFNDAYERGYLLYLIAAIIILVVFVVFFS